MNLMRNSRACVEMWRSITDVGVFVNLSTVWNTP